MCTLEVNKLILYIQIKIISEYNSEDVTSVEGRTYTLNCNGVVGDMVYFTDLDYTADTGHNLAEVKIYGSGEESCLK